MDAGGVVGGSVERLEAADEGHCADVDGGGVMGERGGGDELPEGVDELIRRGHGEKVRAGRRAGVR